ncbi:MAG: HupE/UreJ family protein [Synechococcaceae cyanobacterium]|nr:HupE/UreJ family protein [Synechococcaceae cyanobacterium]
MTPISPRRRHAARSPLPGPLLLALPPLLLLAAPAARAHHLLEVMQLAPTPLSGLLSGLAHPVIGPDHLLFLVSLALVGLRHRVRWALALLATGLGGSALGLVLPGLPGAEALVALSLVVVGLVLAGRCPRALLLPAFALHGYVLSASVLGWTSVPLGAYLVGLLLSQGALLALALTVLRRGAGDLGAPLRHALAGGLIGCGAAWGWTQLVG